MYCRRYGAYLVILSLWLQTPVLEPPHSGSIVLSHEIVFEINLRTPFPFSRYEVSGCLSVYFISECDGRPSPRPPHQLYVPLNLPDRVLLLDYVLREISAMGLRFLSLVEVPPLFP